MRAAVAAVAVVLARMQRMQLRLAALVLGRVQIEIGAGRNRLGNRGGRVRKCRRCTDKRARFKVLQFKRGHGLSGRNGALNASIRLQEDRGTDGRFTNAKIVEYH